MNQQIKQMYKKMHRNEIKIQEWWDYIAGQNQEEVKEVVNHMGEVTYRLRQYQDGFHYKTKIRKYANLALYSDVEPYEVVRVVSEKCVEVRPMETKQIEFPKEFHVGGFSAHCSDQHRQKYEYFSNENAPVMKIRKTKKGWRLGSMRFYMSNAPQKFYDYNF